MSATYRASRRGQMLSMRSAVPRHCFPLKKSEAPAARQGALDCPNDTGSMTQVVLQEDRLQIGARCVGMNPVRFGHNSCSRHRGGTPASAAELTTRMHSRQRVAHHRLRVAIRQRSGSPTLRAKASHRRSVHASSDVDLRVSPPGATPMLRDLETYYEQARGCVPCRAIGGAGRMRRHARHAYRRAARISAGGSASQAVRELGYGAQGNEVNRSLKSVWFAAPPSMGLTLKISSTVRSVEPWS